VDIENWKGCFGGYREVKMEMRGNWEVERKVGRM